MEFEMKEPQSGLNRIGVLYLVNMEALFCLIYRMFRCLECADPRGTGLFHPWR